MLNMKIENYRITSDSNQVILSKVRTEDDGTIKTTVDKNGEEQESQAVIGYYGNLSKCLKAIQRDYLYSEGTMIQSVIEYKKALERITSEFEKQAELEGEE